MKQLIKMVTIGGFQLVKVHSLVNQTQRPVNVMVVGKLSSHIRSKIATRKED